MAYTKQTWADLPSKTTPINANRLTHIEDGIFNAAQTADTAASTAGTAAANVGIVSSRVETLTGRVNGLDTAVSNKVDKVAGKGLSTNDYNNTDKGKIDSLGTASTKNSTSVVTESSDLVESGAVLDTLRDAEVVEGKNILPFDLKQMASINTGGIWNGNTYTLNNATFTVNKDNIVVNGTPSSNTFFYIYQDLNHTKSWNGLKLTGCPSGGSSSTYVLTISNVDITSQTDGGEGVVISIDTTGKVEIRIRIQSGLTVNNLVFKPMISADGGNYQPYYIPLKDVVPQKCDNSVIGTVEDGTNPTRAYAVGEHFTRNRKFCTCTSPVTTSSTWVLNSNYVEGDVAKILDKKTGSMTFADSELSSNITRVNEKSGVVCISASVYTTTSKYTQNQYVLIATISGVAKPDSEVRFPVINSNGSIMIGLLTTSGDIFIYNYSDTSGGTITFNFSYEV